MSNPRYPAMRLPSLLCVALALFISAVRPLPAAGSQRQRPRVAVVLSGGGVKGAAHVGVLRAVEEAGLPIDLIVGTSMGSIVGGLYAMGYTTGELDSLFRHQDWTFVLSDQPARNQLSLAEREWGERYALTVPLGKQGRPRQSGLLRGQNLGNLLARLTLGYHTETDFDSLPIPFACVATNLANGAPIVLRHGVPATAIRASMAIPGVFTPVVRDGMTLVDGGLSDNYPVDVARALGADIVIGSTVQKAFTDSVEFNSVYGVLDQVVSIMCRNRYEENVRNSDICLRIPVSEYSTMDFSAAAIDTILSRGYRTAHAASGRLDSLRRVVFGPDTVSCATGQRQSRHHSPTTASGRYQVSQITFENISPAEAATIRRACRLNDPSGISLAQIEEALRLLRNKFLYVDADYALTADASGYLLAFRAQGKNRSKVGAGGRFDTEEMAAVLLGADLILGTRTPSHLNLTGKLAEQYFVRLGYTLEPRLYRQFSVGYELHHSDINVNERGRRAYNLSYQLHTLTAAYAHQRIRNVDGELGMKIAYYDYGNLLATDDRVSQLKSDFYYTAYLRLRYNSTDKGYFPTRGSRFTGEVAFTTDNISYLARPHAFQSLTASWETVWQLSRPLALLPSVRGRALWGRDIPLPFSNAFGGLLAGRYVEQQLPFVGVSGIEPTRAALAIAGLNVRYNVHGRHYATLLTNAGVENDRLSNLHRGRYIYGFGLQYGLDTKLGPITGTLSYSSNSQKVLFYLGVGFNF